MDDSDVAFWNERRTGAVTTSEEDIGVSVSLDYTPAQKKCRAAEMCFGKIKRWSVQLLLVCENRT